MKKYIFLAVLIFSNLLLDAEYINLTFNGENTFKTAFRRTTAYTGNGFGSFNYGINDLANLKIKADIGDYLDFVVSFNISLLTGIYTDNYKMLYFTKDAPSSIENRTGFISLPFYYSSTYVGSFDLDRLYFKLSFRYAEIETGLIRIPAGLGTIFRPGDFINEINPVNPDARVAGKLGFIARFYPSQITRITLFGLASDNPVEERGWGSKFGASFNAYIKRVNIEFTYLFLLPESEYNKDPEENGRPASTNNDFSHIAGLSVKADIGIGFFFDGIYRFEHRNFSTGKYYDKDFKWYHGLRAAVGIDYTFAGRVYILAEYMFNGQGILDWNEKNLDPVYADDDWNKKRPLERTMESELPDSSYLRHDYLYLMARIKVNEYLHAGPSIIVGIDDIGWIFSPFVQVEPFQAFTLELKLNTPFDLSRYISSMPAAEFGSTNLGYQNELVISAKLKF